MGGEDDACIYSNTIAGFDIGIRATNASTIEKNLIINNAKGIAMGYNAKPVIRHNTIANNSDGIYCPTKASTINYNNIQNNSNYNLFLGSKDNIDATYNWWGTTDTQTINQTIYDFKKDFGLGKVTFVPFLTEPNPEAPEMPESQQPDTEPDAEPNQPDQLTIIVALALIVIPVAAGLGLLVYLSKRK
jgi:parallel beta-helix repeat protein